MSATASPPSGKPAGFMGIWKQIDDADAVDYLHWLTREHMAERVGVPGFRRGRVWRNVQPQPREFFILYDLAEHGVLTSAPYLARLNDPTPWSKRAMAMMRQFVRGGGHVRADAWAGARPGEGGQVALLRFDHAWPAALQGDAGQALARQLAQADGVTRVRLLETVPQAAAPATAEKTLRGGDGVYAGILMVEAADATAAQAAIAQAVRDLQSAGAGDLPAPRGYAAVFAVHSASPGDAMDG